MEGGRTIELGAEEGSSEEDTLRTEHSKLFSYKDLREDQSRHVQRP